MQSLCASTDFRTALFHELQHYLQLQQQLPLCQVYPNSYRKLISHSNKNIAYNVCHIYIKPHIKFIDQLGVKINATKFEQTDRITNGKIQIYHLLYRWVYSLLCKRIWLNYLRVFLYCTLGSSLPVVSCSSLYQQFRTTASHYNSVNY